MAGAQLDMNDSFNLTDIEEFDPVFYLDSDSFDLNDSFNLIDVEQFDHVLPFDNNSFDLEDIDAFDPGKCQNNYILLLLN